MTTTPQAIRRQFVSAFVHQPLQSTALAAVLLAGTGYAAKSYYDWYNTPPAYDAETCKEAVTDYIARKVPQYIQSGTTLTPKTLFAECLQKGPRE